MMTDPDDMSYKKKIPGKTPGSSLCSGFSRSFWQELDSCATGRQFGWFEDLGCGLSDTGILFVAGYWTGLWL